MKNKNSSIAFLLRFFVVGLGMVYLKKWKKALINVIAALVAPYILGFLVGGFKLWMFIAIASGAWAYLETEDLNKKNSANQGMDPTESGS